MDIIRDPTLENLCRAISKVIYIRVFTTVLFIMAQNRKQGNAYQEDGWVRMWVHTREYYASVKGWIGALLGDLEGFLEELFRKKGNLQESMYNISYNIEVCIGCMYIYFKRIFITQRFSHDWIFFCFVHNYSLHREAAS